MKKNISRLIITSLIFLYLPFTVSAALIPECAKSGNPETGGICCALLMVINFSRMILGIVGSVALLMFIIGGFMWITSAGSSERVNKGKSLMTNTIIGIVIVAVAWFAVNFIVNSLAGTSQIIVQDKGTVSWYAICQGEKACAQMGDGWKCQSISSCELQSYDQCDAANNCVRFLCAGSNDRVCCNPNISTGLENTNP